MSAEGGGPTGAAERPRRVTIKDVARESGVSTATVTRAFQRDERLPLATRERVIETAKQLGYRRDHVAQALVTGASRTIGLLIPSIGDLYWAEVVAGIEQRAAEDGFSVLLATSHGDPGRAERNLDTFLGRRIDGIIVADSAGVESSLAQAIDSPVVVVGWDPPLEPKVLERASSVTAQTLLRAGRKHSRAPLVHVAFDDVDAGKQVVRKLLELGHRRIAFLGGPPTLATALRIAGGRIALEEVGLSFSTIATGASTLEGGRDAAVELLRSDRDITAVVAYDDVVAIGVMHAARALRIKVPKRLSVVGFDDIPFSGFVDPPLTSVRQPKHEMGIRAMELLLYQVAGMQPGKAERLRGTLVLRESAAAL